MISRARVTGCMSVNLHEVCDVAHGTVVVGKDDIIVAVDADVGHKTVDRFHGEPSLYIFARVENHNFVTHTPINDVVMAFHCIPLTV